MLFCQLLFFLLLFGQTTMSNQAKGFLTIFRIYMFNVQKIILFINQENGNNYSVQEKEH